MDVKRDRRGFTLLELVVVIMVGAVLVSFAVSALVDVQTRLAVRQARQTMTALHARARAQAVEFGAMTILNLDTAGDSMWVSRNDTTLELFRLQEEFGVDLVGGQTTYSLCMNPRGYGQPSCSNFTAAATLQFASATDTAEVKMYPLGQLNY